jgi:SulP family sulfate permease
MTVVMTGVIASLSAQTADAATALALAFTVVMLAGLLQIALGLLRFGRYITQMPYPVISGFISGVGVILISLQLAPLLGQPLPVGGALGSLRALPQLLSQAQPLELGLGAFTLLVLWATPQRLRQLLPAQLIALLLGTALSLWLPGIPEDLRRIGPIAAGLPQLHLPVLSAGLLQADLLREVVLDAAVLALLGSIDALLTAVIADSLTRRQHDSDRELVAQGLANLVSGLGGALPGAGATMGTVVNIQAGGRSALSGLFRAAILLLVILVGAPLAAQIPQAVLAGIALKVGVDIVDWDFLSRAFRLSRRGALVMALVLVLTVAVDLVVAVAVGVFLANVLTIDRLSALQSQAVRSAGAEAISGCDAEVLLAEPERALLQQGAGRVLLLQLSGPMIYGVARAIAREQQALATVPAAAALVVDLSEVSHLGVSAALALENAVRDALEAGLAVFICGAAGSTAERLQRLRLPGLLPADHLGLERRQALERALACTPALALP